MWWFGVGAFCLGIGIWLGYAGAIHHDPLYFIRGEYASATLWVSESEKNVGDLKSSVLTYWYGMVENLGLPIIILAGLGIAYMSVSILKSRQNWEKIGLLVLLFPIPFFVGALYQGQRPMHVEQISQDLYNVRFALVMVLAAAVFVGYLSRFHVAIMLAALVVASVFSIQSFRNETIVTLLEPSQERQSEDFKQTAQTIVWLRKNYDGGMVLMESFGNDIIHFESKIPVEKLLYEGNDKLWDEALKNPESNVTWVAMRRGGLSGSDKVAKNLYGTEALENFQVVYSNSEFEIYRIVEAATR